MRAVLRSRLSVCQTTDVLLADGRISPFSEDVSRPGGTGDLGKHAFFPVPALAG